MKTEQKPLTPSDLAHISSRNERQRSRPEDIGNLIDEVWRLRGINEDLREACKAQTGSEAGTTHYEKLSMELGSVASQRQWLLDACKMFVAAEDTDRINDAHDVATTAIAKAEEPGL